MSRPVASSTKASRVQGAGWAAVLEPAVLAAVDLDQLARGLAAQPGLVEAPPLLAGEPQARVHHPRAQRVARDLQAVLLGQGLGRERRAEVGVTTLAHQPGRAFAGGGGDLVVRRPAAGLVRDGAAAAQPIGRQQPVDLPRAQRQHRRRRRRDGASAAGHLGQHRDPPEIPPAHRHPVQARSPAAHSRAGRVTFLLGSGVTF
jgi:hypothetical protein